MSARDVGPVAIPHTEAPSGVASTVEMAAALVIAVQTRAGDGGSAETAIRAALNAGMYRDGAVTPEWRNATWAVVAMRDSAYRVLKLGWPMSEQRTSWPHEQTAA